ncbi:hypothetical protein ACNKHX_18515 [Shigella flexneri]
MISRKTTGDKQAFDLPMLAGICRARSGLWDTLPPRQVAYGVVDALYTPWNSMLPTG